MSVSYSENKRSIKLNDEKAYWLSHRITGNQRAPNRISTSKYTLLTFWPINLFEQFRRVANFFFLVVISVQLVPDVSPFPLWTSLLPLVFILGTSAAKEAFEDMTRHRSDHKTNLKRYERVREGGIESVLCESIVPGDILAIHSSQEFPTDSIVLSTTTLDKTCFINTASLDGECVPKIRKSVSATAPRTTPSELWALDARIECNEPCRSLDFFIGRYSAVRKNSSERVSVDLALCNDQFVMRGSVLENCDTCYCVAIFTGIETKVMLNQERHQYKFSGFEKILNRCVLAAISLLVFVVMYLSSGSVLQPETQHILLRQQDEYAFLGSMLTFFVLFSFLIPMSLYVTMEFVKLGQAMMMESDQLVRTDPLDKFSGIQVNSSSMNEELGRIEYVFSDKTGTLTQNKMELSRVVLDGELFDNPFHFNREADAQFNFAKAQSESLLELYHKAMVNDDATATWNGVCLETCRLFFLSLLTCHSLHPVRDGDKVLSLVSQSPDESAMADFMSKLGAQIEDRNTSSVTLSINKSKHTWTILAELPFTSDRRRMAVVVQASEGGPVYLFEKGADSTILPMVRKDCVKQVEATKHHLKACAEQGSRTLVMAARTLTLEEFEEWLPKYQAASSALSKRLKKIDACFEQLEVSMDVVGASAIQDQLQDQVRGTIARLLDAGIQIMILTGDKQETAVHIAYDAGVLRKYFVLLYIRTSDELQSSLERVESGPQKIQYAMIIEGDVLETVVKQNDEIFLQLLAKCKTVVCSRSAPSQKAIIVDLVKRKWHKVCLAIGDGANDVSMIQQAHVGVGLTGKEGTQAAMNADYALSQFWQLRRLIFIHGRFCLVRSTTTVFFSFYKNVAFPMTQFWFAMRSSFSGQSLFDGFVMTFFNLLFTSMPPLISGFSEYDVDEATLMNSPNAYREFLRDPIFTARKFIFQLFIALVHGLLLYYTAEQIYFTNNVMERDGFGADLWILGTQICTAGILLVNLKMFFDLRAWHWYNVAVSLGGFILFVSVYLVYSRSISLAPQLFGTPEHVFLSPVTALYTLLVISMALLIDLAFRFYQQRFKPSQADVLRETQSTRTRALSYKTASRVSIPLASTSYSQCPSPLAELNVLDMMIDSSMESINERSMGSIVSPM